MIKTVFLAILLLAGLPSFAQSNAEGQVLKLSDNVFKWEVESRFDLLEKAFHPKFMVINAEGNSQFKTQYLNRLKSGSFVHNNIKVEESTATVAGNTAVVAGKGRFWVTVAGNRSELHLSYIEVFTRADARKNWQVLAMKASILNK